MTPADDSSTYTLRRVQAMLGLSRHIVSGLVDAGFVKPARGRRNEWRFTFQDLMVLRTAHALRGHGIPPRRIVRSLARLKSTLPAELPLSGLRITAQGPDVAVRERNGSLRAASGQLLLDFEVAPVAGHVAILERTPEKPNGVADARSLYERALAVELSDPALAESLYLQALAAAPGYEDACLNLGAMWAAAGRFSEVVRLCDAALQHLPGSALVHFNRGVALDHLERLEEAAACYERSLVLDPSLADAHFNLAQLHQQAGDERGALRHYNAYRRLKR